MASKKFNYQEKYEFLETIVGELQLSSLSLDDSIEKYEKAVRLIKELEDYLKYTKNRVIEIKKSYK
ncbi:MAG TPA: exodeoxyribonuclease VII small subunit [Candidatus Saccharimonadia bacterium]|nr:exodeoxyribonuclease VII small subunit [Candidatus Saccharimonadia bacterium]